MKCLVFLGTFEFRSKIPIFYTFNPSSILSSVPLIQEVYFIGEVCRGLNVGLITVVVGVVLPVISIVLCCERPPKGSLAHGCCEGLNQGDHEVDYLSSLLGHRVNLGRVVTVDEMSNDGSHHGLDKAPVVIHPLLGSTPTKDCQE